MTQHLLDTARQFHGWGASVNAIVKGKKQPMNIWKELHERPQSRAEMERYNWRYAGGIGINNGPGGYHTFDIDAIKDEQKKPSIVVSDATIDHLLDALHLPRNYPWVWRGKSQAGWALSFRCDEDMPAGALPAKKDEAGVAWGWPAKDSSADWHHLELRYSRNQTVYPPSAGYHWRYDAPSEPPAVIPLHRVIAAFYALCPPPPHNLGTIDDATRTQIRQSFDLVSYAVQHFGGETQRERNGEIRILGHGGLLINEEKNIWNCFGDEIGGDCFDLIAYAHYRTTARNLNGKSADVLKEAAAYAGVTLPERTSNPQTGAATPDLTDTTDTPTDTPTDNKKMSVPRFTIKNEDDLALLPPLTWLQESEVIKGGYHLIYGASGSGKTFYAIRRAMLSAAQNLRVLYIATEDLTGLKTRVAAWRRAFPDQHGTNLTWLDMPLGIDLHEPGQVDELLSAIAPYHYDHIIVDTLREAHTGDENSSQDGAAINRVIQRLIRETGAAIDVVHHSGVESARPRGTTAVFSNADMVLRVSGDGELVTVHCDKLRNSAPFEDRLYALTAATPDTFTPVLRPTEQTTRRGAKLNRIERAVLDALSLSVFAESGAKTRDLLATAEGVTDRTIYRALSHLKDRGFVSQSIKGDPYFITAVGRAQLLPDYVTTPTDTALTAVVSPTDTTDTALTCTDSSISDIPPELTDTDTTLQGVSACQWSQEEKQDDSPTTFKVQPSVLEKIKDHISHGRYESARHCCNDLPQAVCDVVEREIVKHSNSRRTSQQKGTN